MATAQILTNAAIACSISSKVAKAGDFQDTVQQFQKAINGPFTNGTGNGKADILWSDSVSLDADTTHQRSLNEILTDVFGDTVEFVNIKAMLIHNTSTTASVISVSANPTQGWAGSGVPFNAVSQKQNILPDSFWMVGNTGDGWPVVNGASENFDITEESSLAALYDIIILGASVATP